MLVILDAYIKWEKSKREGNVLKLAVELPKEKNKFLSINMDKEKTCKILMVYKMRVLNYQFS